MRSVAIAVFSLAVACSGSVNLGSDVIWFAEHEGDEADEWSRDSAGGLVLGNAGSSVVTSPAQARGGIRSLFFITPATGADSGSLVYRSVPVPSEAYYSAWYFIPRSYVTRSYLTIMKFHSHEPEDPELHDRGIDINLRDLRDGTFVLYPLHHDNAFLQPPLALPTPVVPVGRWFQVEAFFRAARDSSGRVTIWLDGRQVYDLDERPTLVREEAYFSVCNLSRDAQPNSVEIYVDDVAVSRSRVTATGILR